MTLVEIIVGWYWHKVRRVWPFNIIRHNFCSDKWDTETANAVLLTYSVDCAWAEFKLYSLQNVLLKILKLKQMIIGLSFFTYKHFFLRLKKGAPLGQMTRNFYTQQLGILKNSKNFVKNTQAQHLDEVSWEQKYSFVSSHQLQVYL